MLIQKMGRSKFPGKPTKHVNRTRVNVLSTVVNTTVVGDSNPTVVTVEEGDDSKKVQSEESQPEQTEKATRTRKKRIIANKRTPIKRTILLSSTHSPLNTSTRLTRSKAARRAVRGFSSIRKLTKPKHSISPKKEVSNLVGKFVLPSRSVHSSRVIKPNKRFINIESGETRIVKKRIVNKRQCVKVDEKECELVESKDNSKNGESSKSEELPSPPQSNGKVVLRQARLQIKTKTTLTADGPFTMNASSISPPGTVTCGVCGAVRFYRFVRQARKFNIYSCESCRKFISKLIQRSNNKTLNTTLTCHKGQGMCLVPPIVRSQQWKFNHVAYNARCPACWLKLCLRSFQMPLALKTTLSQFLPKNMQAESLFTNTLPLLTWQSNKTEATTPNTSPVNKENKDITIRQRPVRLKPVKKDERITTTPHQSDIRRQKIDCKGPRVKLVCRSASIVLGQPFATFPAEKKPENVATEKIDHNKIEVAIAKGEPEPDNVPAMTVTDKLTCTVAAQSENKIDEPATSLEYDNTILGKSNKDSSVPTIISKKEKNKGGKEITSMLPLEITKPSVNKKSKKIASEVDNSNLLDIDYWENYDPDEVVCNGLSIIASENLPMQAICFLCGSAGKEILLHCCICCEPYHPYCLEQGPPNFTCSEQKYTWICPKCTTCSACGEADKQKINCQKCHKAYHPTCFNTKWRTDDRPTVCSKCLRCKSCGTDNITKFVGNLALCLICFKLRNKGNYCPLCQCCYDDNDFDTKMMECGKCNKWVHAKCEGLSDEQYQILSILPESVEFLCCLCATQSTPYWRKAVQSELRSCFNNILRLLSKNRVARDMLKLSPLKAFTPLAKGIFAARRLQFLDGNDSSGAATETDNSIDNDLEQVNNIFKNKIDFGDSFNCSLLNDSKIPTSPSMVEIKTKLNCNEYFSLSEFNEGMEQALHSTGSDELFNIYRSILKNVFPWFDPNLKEELNKSICDTSLISKTEEEKKLSYEIFDMHVPETVDNRVCNLCKGVGDGLPNKEARLLYCGQNDWIHANCALWSSEVYEEIDGSLQNVQGAITRGRSIRCAHCRQRGASAGCCLKGCYETYHFPCAQKANCHFIADKTIYCKNHDVSNNTNILTTEGEFEIRRSVYVEVESKKKKSSDADKINYMVGSLSVINLGRIIPSVSDNAEALIPVGYVCYRLFWSTTKPWKLIPYQISTSILNTQSQNYIDKNFTIDHTLPKHLIEKKLKEVCLWQKDDKDKSDLVDFEDYEEPQNAGDILSPELTDAILEELPHDLLDGISVQDMLMSYEELMLEINCNDNLSLNMNNETKLDDCEETNNKSKELKRSKSEVFQKMEDKMKPRSQQRSCSLTWLQLLDNSPAMKKRKIGSRDNMFMQLLQVDGACDSSGSECGSPTHETEIIWFSESNEEPVTCEKCQCTYRTDASYKRHLESCEAMFTSESETENETLIMSEIQEPQVITSYETYSTFQTTQKQIQSTVLNSQTILAESTKLHENNGVYYNFQTSKPVMTQQANVINLNQPITINAANDNQQQILNQFCVNQQNVCMNQNVSLNQQNLISVDKGSLSINPSIISVDNTQVLNQMNSMNSLIDIQQQPVSIQSFAPEVSPLLNITQQNQAITIDTKMMAPNVLNPVMNIPQNNWIRPMVPQTKHKPRSRIVAKKATNRMQSGTLLMQNSPSVIVQHIPSSNMLPFVDAFQQHHNASQNVQFLTTLSPQMNSTLTPQAQLVQLPENNFLSIVPNVQPTMIIQQPRVDAGQLILDSNGSMMWAPQPVQQVQPVYYGFETIVQNTVMQSQQFLPTTVPGVLTTNSSYSATTQVFQTSKLEPVLDGSYVLVNPNQLVNQQTVQVPQIQTNVASQSVANNVQMHNKANTWNHIEAQPSHVKPIQVVTTLANNSTTNSITLPVAPFVPEHGIPTNVVTPTPKPPTSQSRPMSRVLPMQTVASQQKKLDRVPPVKQIVVDYEIEKIIKNVEKQKNITVLEGVIIMENPQASPPQEKEFKNEIKTNVKNEIIKSNIQNIKNQASTRNVPTKNIIPRNITETYLLKNDYLKIELQNELLKEEIVKNTLLNDDLLKASFKNDLVHNEETKIKNDFLKEDMKKELMKVELLKDETKIGVQIKPETTPEIKKITLDEFKLEKEVLPIKEVQKEDLKQIKEFADILKLNKAHVAPLKCTKPKTLASQSSDNKENTAINTDPRVSLENNLDEPMKQVPPKLNKRSNVNNSAIYYKVESADGVDYTSISLPQIWRRVFSEVQAARTAHNLPPLPDIALRTINALDLLGLKTKGMKYLLEQLPDATKCKTYKPMFHKRVDGFKFEEDDDEDGCKRCQPLENKREKYDMFGWLASKHRTLEMYDLDAILKRNASTSLPMAMRFRALRVISKYSVGVYRSEIHGRGLFSLRDIEAGEMVIEYAGEVIRSILTDKREKYYNSKGIGCYMFRIDDNLVVDATMKGNAARFINHSCDPNCYSKVVEILGCKHIIIFALRKIICGEELTYDYKFPFEEDKIPCTCGTKRCRKFLN